MNNFIYDLHQRLNAELQKISRQEIGAIQKARSSAMCISQHIIQLRAFILQYAFREELEEIDFFKTTKPDFLSKYIYHTKIYHIESRRPTGDRSIHHAYLRKEMERIAQFQTLHPEFYQYQTFNELKYRTNPTRYVDQLKASFLKKIEEMD